MSNLAILGGTPVIKSDLTPYNSIGEAEIEAVTRVLRTGVLSAFYGSMSEEFWGGPRVQEFEGMWAERFRAKHCISVNSATSGLYTAMGAIGIGPDDEVIVPPYTMSATVMAPLVYGGIPIFADIEKETFGLDPKAVEKAVTKRTKAILAVNLFGHPAMLDDLMEIARRNDIYLIEDNAQGPLAEDNGRLAGTIGHIGVFSLNFHKHIHTGEGGMCVTDDDELALRMKLIRNHGENVVESLGIHNINNLVGFNYRLTELQASVGIEQLKKIDEHVEKREKLGKALTEGIRELNGLNPPKVRSGCRHVYYVWGLRFEEKEVGVSRDLFCRALIAEGFPVFQGYVKPMYLLPIFQRKVAIGAHGYPFSLSPGVEYPKGLCPVCERMHEKEFIGFEPCAYEVNEEQKRMFVEVLHKVFRNLDELKEMSN